MAEHRIASSTGPGSGGRMLPASLKPGEPLVRTPRPREASAPAPRYLRRPLRPHVAAFSAFVRLADSIADDPMMEPETKLHHLDALEKALVEGKARRPYLRPAVELKDSLRQTGVPDRHARQILQAFRKDAGGQVCRSWSDLLLYCRYAAAPAGRYLLELHGEDHAAAAAPSDALRAASLVLGALQDCRTDWVELGRCYVPQQWFEEAGVPVERLVETRSDERIRAVFDRVLSQVDALLGRAAALPALVQDRALRLETATQLAEATALAARLRRRDPLARRVQLPWARRVAVRMGGLARAMAGG
jgi:phytoene/squalene synthetase